MSTTDTSIVTNTGNNFGSFGYRSFVLWTLTIVYTFNFIDRILISVMGGPIIAEFGLSNFEFGILSGIGFALFYTMLGIPIANFSERHNRVRIIGICVILWSLATVLCGFATGFVTLLLARLLVGIGEAGCTPPANSLISDYYKPVARPTALGIYAMGVTAGGVLAQLGGGWVIQNFTWREAFIYVGAPGIIIGILVLLTIKEPPRGYSDPPTTKSASQTNFKDAIVEIFSKPTFWIMAVGATLAAFAGYGLVGFTPLFIQYVHGYSAGETAIMFMAPVGLAATLGAFLGGYLTQTASKKSETAPTWVSGIAFLIAVPFYAFSFFASDHRLMLAMLMLGSVLQYFYIGAQYNIAQAVVSVRSRATAVAVLLFVVNLIGYGFGPPIIGLMADIFASNQLASGEFAGTLSSSCNFADASLSEAAQSACRAAKGYGIQMACVAATALFALAGLFFLISGRTFVRDRYVSEPAT